MKALVFVFCFWFFLCAAQGKGTDGREDTLPDNLNRSAGIFFFEAGETLRAVELDCGEQFSFKLKNGQTRTFKLLSTSARVLYSNLKKPKKAQPDGALVYEMRARLLADGQPFEMVRYASTQEAFYEPWVVNGVRLWFDGVRAVDRFITEKHGECLPKKDARFAFQDATLRVCPDPVFLSLDVGENTLPIERIHNGDDTWMGAFLGADAHNGLDINSPAGSLLFAPVSFDTQFLFESLADGDDNNRWRGLRTWADGAQWIWQAHHVLSVFPEKGAPLEAGRAFCETAGVKYGAHTHTHFLFKITPPGYLGDIGGSGLMVDPWILFWQGFEDRRNQRGEIRAQIDPLAPAKTGEAVRFSAEASRGGVGRKIERYVWKFGDGAVSHEKKPSHVFRRAGVYFITLTVDDGAHLASCTQALTVHENAGFQETLPAFILDAPLETGFQKRMAGATDVYGISPSQMPARLQWVWRGESEVKPRRTIDIKAANDQPLPPLKAAVLSSESDRAAAWLSAQIVQTQSGAQVLVALNEGWQAKPGRYLAQVRVEGKGALNPVQSFEVELLVPSAPAFPPRSRRVQHPTEKIVSCQSPKGFYATPYFWIAPQFQKQPEGFAKPYLISGNRGDPEAFARFAPDLETGMYRVRFARQTPFAEGTRFQVRVRHANGIDVRWVEPAKDRIIGEFAFCDGIEGFVDLLAKGATGQVIADAIVFERLSPQ